MRGSGGGGAWRAAMLGGTGSVGRPLLRKLLEDPSVERVVMLNRRRDPVLDEELKGDADLSSRVVQKVVSMGPETSEEDLREEAARAMRGENVKFLFMTLGSGSSKKLSKEELYRVDCGIPSAVGKAAKDVGVQHAVIMSAVGSDANSAWSSLTRTAAGGGWYRHVKGVMETNFQNMGFETCSIVQPSTIIGSPATPPTVRIMACALDPLVKVVASNFRCVRTHELASAMAALASAGQAGKLPLGTNFYSGNGIFTWALAGASPPSSS